MIVTLTPSEMMSAGQVGLQRHIANIAANRTDRHGATPGDFSPHILGSMGEMAVAKALGVFWSGSSTFATRNAGDLPGGVEVRTTAHANGRLLVHPSDPDDRRFVLVVAAPPTFTVCGWLFGRDAKIPANWQDPTGKGRHAYFVERSALLLMSAWADPLRARVEGNAAVRRLVEMTGGQVEGVERSRLSSVPE